MDQDATKNQVWTQVLMLVLLFLWFCSSLLMSLFVDKVTSFQWINQAHHPSLDVFFTVVTSFGNGLLLVCISIGLFVMRKRILALGIFMSYILSGLLAQLLKRFFSMPRPAGFFGDISLIHTVSWLSPAYNNSFPSGHTTSAFAVAIYVVLFCQCKRQYLISSLVIIMAILVAYSRVYLGLHFVQDVWFGSLLGSAVAVSCHAVQMAALRSRFVLKSN